MILAYILTGLMSFVLEPSLLELRKLYYSASESKQAAIAFLQVVEDQKSDSPVAQAYHAMAYMMQAKYAFNPYLKMSHFNKGKAMLEEAVERAPSAIEIRFLRYCVQTNAPFFLNYSSDISSDKAAILKGWKTIQDADLKSRIKEYMLASDDCNEHEKSVFR